VPAVTEDADPADGPGTDRAAAARAYYAALDAGDYDRLAGLLAPSFVHRRPDRTLSGRDRFVGFMREERPATDTTHAVRAVYSGGAGVAVRGELLAADGDRLFEFVDAFGFDDGRIASLDTYTR